ncbi:DUF433 domain-containing protein [Deferrisoma camini]|uniref:DUF433 domain-containing protein n=1 Tax=Deferrisoma camini TaxID=1035120 RepID=UPI00046CD512|nr:DUF433 domain-containing protein [Deferrisoma camini]
MKRWDRITVDPHILNGQPCIRGMRLTVRRVLEALAVSANVATVFEEYPELEEEDIRQALDFAAHCLTEQTIDLDAA